MALPPHHLDQHPPAWLPAPGAAVLGAHDCRVGVTSDGTTSVPSLTLVQMNYSESCHKVDICIPPVLADEARRMASEDLHPAWTKCHQRGKHFFVSTDSLEDISELADFARVELEEPDAPLSKAKRAACQALLSRTHRYAVLEPLGDIHCIAVAWREKPLRSMKYASRLVKQLRDQADSPLEVSLLGRGSRTSALTAGREDNGR